VYRVPTGELDPRDFITAVANALMLSDIRNSPPDASTPETL
jgi:hypothetical protein